MNTQEKQMTHEESLALIQSMIDTARQNVADDGFHLLLWGSLVIACSLINYILLLLQYNNIAALPWLLMPLVGTPIGIWYGRRQRRMGRPKTHVEMQVAYLWRSYGVTLFFVIFYSVMKQVSPVPYILMITGMVTFATGLMIRFRPLYIGGILFWIFTVVSFFTSPMEHLPLEAVAIFVGYIIPGLLLRRQAKLQDNV